MGVWFLDTRAALAASDANALGLDPYRPNPLDLFHQPHVYSNWWFALDWIGLTRADYLWLGALLGLVFLMVASLTLRVRSTGELLWSAAFLTAPPVVLGVNRGNADLLLFLLLTPLVPCLLSRHRFFQGCAIGGVGLATGLKFFPAAAAILWLSPATRRRERLIGIAVLVGMLSVLALKLGGQATHYLVIGQPQGFFTFGAGVVAELLSAPEWVGHVTSVVMGGLATLLFWRHAPPWDPPAHQKAEHLNFILGATMIAGCYFVAVNYAYRYVFGIWMAPFLWTAWSGQSWPVYYQRLSRIVAVLWAVCLWSDGLVAGAINLISCLDGLRTNEATDRIVLLEQPFVAALMIGLLGFLVPFAREGLQRLIFSPKDRPESVPLST